jgi:hypothetical protein
VWVGVGIHINPKTAENRRHKAVRAAIRFGMRGMAGKHEFPKTLFLEASEKYPIKFRCKQIILRLNNVAVQKQKSGHFN